MKSMQPDKRLFTPSEIYTTFKKMSDGDLTLLGLSEEYARPEWMILTMMPVPPPPVRPSIAVDGGTMRSEDDLTYKLGDIIRASQNVRRCEQEGAPAHVISEFEQLLQVCLRVRAAAQHADGGRVSSTSRRTWTTTSRASRRRCRSPGGL
jgi:DNA-directed RNA polymerase II subunit RPB1